MRDAVVERWGDEVAPGRRRRPLARSRATRSPSDDERAWLEGCIWPRVGAARRGVPRGGARAPTRRRAPRSSRRRCSSRPAWTASTTRRSRSSPTRTSAPSARAPAATTAVDERAARQLPQDEKARACDVRRAQRRHGRRARGAAVGRPWQAGVVSTMARTRRPARAAHARRAGGGAGSLLARRGRAHRRRIGALLPRVDEAVQEVTLPLRHDDIIRQQAADKDLDPSLIAAVIYAESRFRDATSHAGARGLMQITPADRARDRAALGRHAVRAGRPRRRRRSTSPTARGTCAGCSSRYGEQRDARGRRLQRGHRQRRPVDRARPGHEAPRRSRSPRRARTWRRCSTRASDYRREYAARARPLGPSRRLGVQAGPCHACWGPARPVRRRSMRAEVEARASVATSAPLDVLVLGIGVDRRRRHLRARRGGRGRDAGAGVDAVVRARRRGLRARRALLRRVRGDGPGRGQRVHVRVRDDSASSSRSSSAGTSCSSSRSARPRWRSASPATSTSLARPGLRRHAADAITRRPATAARSTLFAVAVVLVVGVAARPRHPDRREGEHLHGRLTVGRAAGRHRRRRDRDRHRQLVAVLPEGCGGVRDGAAILFFAYIGFDIVATTAEESQNAAARHADRHPRLARRS